MESVIKCAVAWSVAWSARWASSAVCAQRATSPPSCLERAAPPVP